MIKTSAVIVFTFLLIYQDSNSFKNTQLKYKRVKGAYEQKWTLIESLYKANAIEQNELMIYLRVFKYDRVIEVWGKNKKDEFFRHLINYPLCSTSGKLGPKRKEGDLQIPEGFYYIDAFNPWSNFHLSMRINYPNASDKVLSHKKLPGGNICIHGSCVTIGCMPITDDLIKESYILCIEAKNNGQNKIPVTIFPAKLSEGNFAKLKRKYVGQTDKINLWSDLKFAYEKFNSSKQLPTVKFLSNGRHVIE